jgi:hypothetical protein
MQGELLVQKVQTSQAWIDASDAKIIRKKPAFNIPWGRKIFGDARVLFTHVEQCVKLGLYNRNWRHADGQGAMDEECQALKLVETEYEQLKHALLKQTWVREYNHAVSQMSEEIRNMDDNELEIKISQGFWTGEDHALWARMCRQDVLADPLRAYRMKKYKKLKRLRLKNNKELRQHKLIQAAWKEARRLSFLVSDLEKLKQSQMLPKMIANTEYSISKIRPQLEVAIDKFIKVTRTPTGAAEAIYALQKRKSTLQPLKSKGKGDPDGEAAKWIKKNDAMLWRKSISKMCEDDIEWWDEVWLPFWNDECEASEKGNLKFECRDIHEKAVKRGLPSPPMQEAGRQAITLMPFFVPPDTTELFIGALDISNDFFDMVKDLAHKTHYKYRIYSGSLRRDVDEDAKLRMSKKLPTALAEHHFKFKSIRRTCQKAVRSTGRFSSACDILQAALVYDTVEELVYALRFLRNKMEGVELVDALDSFNAKGHAEQADMCGFRQASVYLRLNGHPHICELNLHISNMYNMRKMRNESGYQGRLWLWKDARMAL